MEEIKKKIENMFADATRFIYRRHWLFLFFMFVLIASMIGQLPKITINTSNESFLHQNDLTLAQYNNFKDQFGRDDFIVVAIKSQNIFSHNFLRKLQKLHQDLEDNLPHLEEITSLVNARNTRGEKDQLIVEDLLENWPENDIALQNLQKRVMRNPLYRNRLISDDGTFTTIMIETDAYSKKGSEDEVLAGFEEYLVDNGQPSEKTSYLTDKENSAVVKATHEIASKYGDDNFTIYIAGSPVVTDTVKKSMLRDMPLFMRLALLIIGICLFIVFRRISGIFLPILIVGLSILTTLGLMALTGTQFKVPTIILPSFLMAVGVGDCVHVLAIFYHHFKGNGNKEDAIVYALSHSGLAIVMTSLTTAAGLASFAAAEVAPIADLGLFSSVGVLLALIYTIILLPALISLIPIKIKPEFSADPERTPLFDRFLDHITDLTATYPKLIIVLSVLVIILSFVGASKLHFRHDILSWLPEKMSVRQSTAVIDQELKGTVALEVIVDTRRENGLYDQDLLLTLEKLTTEVEEYRDGDLFVGKVISVVDVLKEIHQALNENRPDFYIVPENEKLIPQEFLLFENSGSDDLEDVVDSRFQQARITIKVPWFDAIKYVPFMQQIENKFKKELQDKATVTMTGIMSLFGRIIFAAIHSAAQSYGIAFVVISLMMILLIGNIRLGLVSMLPNLGPIVVIMGIMGWFELSLDMFTMLIASIAIGLAVDDTIHFMYNFRKYYAESGDAVSSIRITLHTAGRAMLVTSIVLSIGFFIFMLSTLSNVFYFGMLTGIAIILALGADFLFAPALMVLLTRSNKAKAKL